MNMSHEWTVPGEARRFPRLKLQVFVPSNMGIGRLMKNGNALSTEPSSLQLQVSTTFVNIQTNCH